MLSLIPAQTLPDLPGPHAVERFVLEDQVRNLLVTFEEDRKDCVKYMVSIPYGDRFPLEYIIVEVRC